MRSAAIINIETLGQLPPVAGHTSRERDERSLLFRGRGLLSCTRHKKGFGSSRAGSRCETRGDGERPSLPRPGLFTANDAQPGPLGLFRRGRDDLLDLRLAVVLRKMRVPHGHADVLVAEKLLDRPEIDTLHHEPGRKGMPEILVVEIPDPRPL